MPWPYPHLAPKDAIALQEELRGRVVRRGGAGRIATVAGVDVAVGGRRARAAVVVLGFPGLEHVETRTADLPLTFPYVPGLLAFREMPAILAAWDRLRTLPDLVLVDGHGLAHPRRFGIACFLGVHLDRPTVGCGKSRLVGEHPEPRRERGSTVPLRHRGEVIASVLRTRAGVKPIYVSVGHRLGLPSAVRVVLACSPRFRVPEPIRQADRAAGRV